MSYPKCQQCPSDDKKEEYPPPPSNPKFIELECGHQVHFHCFRNSYYKENNDTHNFCTECDEPLHNSEVEDFFHPPDLGVDVPRLWNNSKEFRESIKTLSKAEKEYYKEKKRYLMFANKIKKEYTKNIKPALSHIKFEKKTANKNLRSISNKKVYSTKAKAYHTVFHDVIHKYGICLNDIQSNLPTVAPTFDIDTKLMWKKHKLKNPDIDLSLIPFKLYNLLY